jgi:hypothetical protein
VKVTVKVSSSRGWWFMTRVFQVAKPMLCFRVSPQVGEGSSHVFGAMKSRGAPAPADSTKEEEVRGIGRVLHRWIARRRPHIGLGADTAVSIEREVVSGHAYAVLTPEPLVQGWCGYENPTYVSVDGVLVP